MMYVCDGTAENLNNRLYCYEVYLLLLSTIILLLLLLHSTPGPVCADANHLFSLWFFFHLSALLLPAVAAAVLSCFFHLLLSFVCRTQYFHHTAPPCACVCLAAEYCTACLLLKY